MDSFTRKYLGLLTGVAVIGLFWWLLSLDSRVGELNAALDADPELAGYPYQFRVLSLEGGIAEISSPRSAEVPVMRFLRVAFPDLANTAVTSPQMMAAQQRLAKLQSRAADRVREHPEVHGVRWTLDQRWYAERGVTVTP